MRWNFFVLSNFLFYFTHPTPTPTPTQLRYHCMNIKLDGWRHGKENKMRRKMLIVDDSIVTRKLVRRAFEKANFTVDMAENGDAGVEVSTI